MASNGVELRICRRDRKLAGVNVCQSASQSLGPAQTEGWGRIKPAALAAELKVSSTFSLCLCLRRLCRLAWLIFRGPPVKVVRLASCVLLWLAAVAVR